MVSSKGFVNLLDAGKVDVLNLSLSAAREAIELALIREGLDTNFDLIISEYNSQKFYLVVPCLSLYRFPTPSFLLL